MSLYKIVFYGAFAVFLISWAGSLILHFLGEPESIILEMIVLISALICFTAYSIKWKTWRRKKREPKGPGGVMY